MEQILNWLEQNQGLALIVAVICLFFLVLTLKNNTTKTFASNRSVSAGRDINAPIMTGDKNTNKLGVLGILASIATILGFLVTLYLLITK
jgi:hypothetical protein